MKKMFTLMLFTVVSAFSAAEAVPAKVESINARPINIEKQINISKIQNGPVLSDVTLEHKNNVIQASPKYILVDTIYDGLSANFRFSTPIAFNPISKSLAYVSNKYYYNTSLSKAFAYFGISTLNENDLKFTLRATKQYEDGGIFQFPSISISGTSANPSIYVSSYVYKYNAGNYPLTGMCHYLYQPNETYDDYVIDGEGPSDNNTGNMYIWGVGKISTFNNGSTSKVLAPNIPLAKVSGNFNNTGDYAIRGYETSPVFKFEEATSTVPAQMQKSKFIAEPAGGTGTYQSNMNCDYDSEGNVYVAINHLFASDETKRVPGVAKSTDNGKTWTEFNLLPSNLISDYLVQNGFTQGVSIAHYKEEAFVVTGVDEYSYFLIYDNVENGLLTNKAEIIEAHYSKTQWKINKVADLDGLPNMPDVIYDANKYNQDSSSAKWRMKLNDNPLGHELQAAKTADGTSIIVKWIDYNTKIGEIPLGGSYALQVSDDVTVPFTVFTSLPTTDVFMSTKSVNSDTWNSKNNVTADTSYDRCVWIPQIVPSVNKIPMMKYQTASSNIPDTQTSMNTLPRMILERISDVWSFVTFTTVDATKSASGVEENEVVANFEIKNISPNPVNNDVTEIIYSVDQATTVSLEVFDAMGKKVATAMPNTQVMPGTYGINFNTNNISSGTYYITLNSNGKSVTKVLSVVK